MIFRMDFICCVFRHSGYG